VRRAVEKFGASERFACKIIGQNRSAFRKTKPDPGFEETRLRSALHAIAIKHPAWGGGKPAGTCSPRSGLDWRSTTNAYAGSGARKASSVNPRRGKKRRTGPGAGEQKRLTADYPMHVVSFDFQSDVTSCRRHIRFFNVIDEYTRTALAIIARRSFTASDVVAVLEFQ